MQLFTYNKASNDINKSKDEKQLFLLALMMSCLLLITACASSKTSNGAISKEVKVEPFHSITTSSSIDVIYTQSSGKQQVVIYTTSTLMDRVKVVVENGVLKVSFKRSLKSISIKDESLEVRVTAPAVNALSASSSGDIKAKDLKARTVTASASSSGDISCYATDKLKANTTSGGDIKYKGTPKQIQSDPKVNLKQIK